MSLKTHPVPTTVAQAEAWLRSLANGDRLFHPDDDPADIEHRDTREPLFGPDEVEAVRQAMGACHELLGDDAYGFCLRLSAEERFCADLEKSARERTDLSHDGDVSRMYEALGYSAKNRGPRLSSLVQVLYDVATPECTDCGLAGDCSDHPLKGCVQYPVGLEEQAAELTSQSLHEADRVLKDVTSLLATSKKSGESKPASKPYHGFINDLSKALWALKTDSPNVEPVLHARARLQAWLTNEVQGTSSLENEHWR